MGEHVIEITADGKVHALHSDAFPLQFLGDMKVYRQTNIVSTNNGETWDIIYLYPSKNGKKLKEWTCPAIQGLPTYEVARRVEVEWVNSARGLGVQPFTATGEGLALWARWNTISGEMYNGVQYDITYNPGNRTWDVSFIRRVPAAAHEAKHAGIWRGDARLRGIESYKIANTFAQRIMAVCRVQGWVPWCQEVVEELPFVLARILQEESEYLPE